ncbi:hypothetical protein [Nostoc sp.]|uniref:hypothetical protein n=1 Tax=Nostoc sp. TaxID=1180 RepID=UPI002FFB9658
MDAIAKIAVEVVGILSIMKRICNMVNIFTITSFSAFVFASTTTLLLVQTVTAKPVQIKKQVNQAKPLNSGVRIYPANNSLPASRLITIERAIKKSSNMHRSKTYNLRGIRSPNRNVQIIDF